MLAERLKIPEISNQSKVKITVDIDGVLGCVDLIVLKLFNEKFGTNYQLKDLDDFNAIYNWAKKHGMSDNDADALNRLYWYESPQQIHRNALLMPGAPSLMKKLSESPLVDLYITTSRPLKEFGGATYDWFDENLSFIKHDRIIFDNKFEAVAKINSDIHIDDLPNHAQGVLDRTNAYVIMVPFAYNYQKLQHERLIEYDPSEVDLNNLPNLWPIYRLFRKNGII